MRGADGEQRPGGSAAVGGLWRALISWGVILAVSVFVVLDFRAPAPASEDAPPEAFSADRAWDDLVEISRAPHPTGSFEYATVREYLTDRLSELGYEVRVQVATVDEGPTVSNVLGRLEGTCGSDLSVMLVSHYDSNPSSPGAGDAGAGVSAIIETARALTAGEALCNDVIVLLTGGEESGLAGSEAFVKSDEWADDVGMIVNFDARGGTGPLLLSEWSQASPELVRAVTAVVPRAFSNSLLNESMERNVQHSTDFAELKKLGVPGVNAVHVGDSVYYHTPGDTPAVVSRATLQHDGETALALARHFGNEDLADLPDAGDAVWVSLTSELFVAYESWVAVLVAAVVVALLVTVLWAARRRGARWGRLAGGALAFLVAALCSVVVVTALLALIRAVHPDADVYLHGFLPSYEDLPNPEGYWWAFVAVAGAVSTLVLGLVRRWLTVVELAVSGVALVAVLGVLATVFTRPVSYFFVIPALGSLAGALVWLTYYRGTLDRLGATLTLAVATIPALLMYVGFLRFSAVASLGLAALFMPIVALLFAVLVPQLEALRDVRRWIAPSALGLLAAVLLVVGAVTVNADPTVTAIGSPDVLADVDELDTAPFDQATADSAWVVGTVTTDDDRVCLEASVPDDSETGDIGWCPLPTDLRPPLDFQWGRTATGESTRVLGARSADDDDAELRPPEDSAAILFGDADEEITVVRVSADGVDYEVWPTHVEGLVAPVWAVALPPGTAAVEEIVALDDSGKQLASIPGFQLLPEEGPG